MAASVPVAPTCVEFYQKMRTRNRNFFSPFVLSVALIGMVLSAGAATIDVDFSGQFQQDNDVFCLDFTVDSDRFVSIFTSSWLSPNSGLGFDTALGLWDDAGVFLNFNDDVLLPGSETTNTGTYSYGENDAFLNDIYLGAGSYTLALLQTGNFPISGLLTDGFSQDGNPNYTRDVYHYGPEPYFNGVYSNDPRTGDWELHLVGISTYSVKGAVVPIPEPAALALLGFAISAGLLRRRPRL